MRLLQRLTHAVRTRQTSRPSRQGEHRARLAFERLEERQVPAIITDMTQLALQFGRHAGPSVLYLNFDGSTAEGVSAFQSVSGDLKRDVHEVLFRTQEIFAPFDVTVRRLYGNGSVDTSSAGNTTVFIGDKASYGVGSAFDGASHHGHGAANGSGAYTPWSSSDFPSPGNKGITHQPNSDAYDIAFVDPLYYSAASGTNVSRSVRWIAQAAAHEAGHTFGLVHVLSSPDPEIMSYDAANTRFVNKTFGVTDLNYNPSTGSNYNEPKLQPQWLNWVYAPFPIPVVTNITTQNSYTYLQAALGARSIAGDWANVADSGSVDASYADGSSPTLGVGSSTTGGVGRASDWDVLNLSVASSGWVRVDVTRYGGSTVDPVLLVYNGTGQTFVTFNDDRAAGDLNSQVVFYASAGQTYKLAVGGYGSNSTGNYQVSVNPHSRFLFDYALADRAVLLTAADLGAGTGSGGAGASAGAGSAVPAAQDQVFADPAQPPVRRVAPGNASYHRENSLREAASHVAQHRLPGLGWERLVDELSARGVFAS